MAGRSSRAEAKLGKGIVVSKQRGGTPRTKGTARREDQRSQWKSKGEGEQILSKEERMERKIKRRRMEQSKDDRSEGEK